VMKKKQRKRGYFRGDANMTLEDKDEKNPH